MDNKSKRKNPHYDEYYVNNDSKHSCYYKDFNAYWRHEADYGLRKPRTSDTLRRSIDEGAFESIFGYHGSKWVFLVHMWSIEKFYWMNRNFDTYEEAFKWADDFIKKNNGYLYTIEEGWLTNGAKDFNGLHV